MVTAQATDFERIAGMRCGGDPIGYCVAPLHNCGGSCQGTGYRFPWLRRKCEHTNGKCSVPWHLLEGEGERLLGLLKVARESGLNVDPFIGIDGYTELELYPDGFNGAALEDRKIDGEAKTFFDALASALAKALEVRE